MINALVASTGVIIPVQAHFYSLDGLKRILDTMRHIRARFYPCRVAPLGVVLTFVEDRTALSKRIETGLRDLFGALVFNTVIHKSVALAEAPSQGRPFSPSPRTTRGPRSTRRWPRKRSLDSTFRRSLTWPGTGRSDPARVSGGLRWAAQDGGDLAGIVLGRRLAVSTRATIVDAGHFDQAAVLAVVAEIGPDNLAGLRGSAASA
jgi:hypothetical protein